jgi:hypothetical protein
MLFLIPGLAAAGKFVAAQVAVRGGAKIAGRAIFNYAKKNGLDKAITKYGKRAVDRLKKVTMNQNPKFQRSNVVRPSKVGEPIKSAGRRATKGKDGTSRALTVQKKGTDLAKTDTSKALTVVKKDYPLVVKELGKNEKLLKLTNNPSSKLNEARLKTLEKGLKEGFPKNKLLNKVIAATTVGSIGALLLQDETKPTKADKPERGVTRKERKIDNSSDYSRASSDYRSRGTGSGSNRDALAKAKRPSYFQDIDAKSSSRKSKSKSKDTDKDKDDSSNVRTGSGGKVLTERGNVKTDRKKRKRPYDPSMMGIRMGRNFESGGLVKADKYFKRGASNK